jgi:ATP:ADP antiporter, AAA family
VSFHRSLLSAVVDVRGDERRALFRAAASFFLIIAAHTMLETTRDAIVLTRLPARALGATYLVAAAVVLPASLCASRFSPRVGARKALFAGLLTVSAAVVGLFALPTSTASVLGLCVVSSLLGAVLISLFWNLLGDVFTIAQGRRLLGVVVAAGSLGAVSASSAAAAFLAILPVRELLVVSAAIAAVAVVVLPDTSAEPRPKDVGIAAPVRERPFSEPYVRQVAWLVASSTAAFVVLDFTFKWSVTREVPPDRIANFVARSYALMSAAGLIAQLVFSTRLVQRFGTARTLVVAPVVVVSGSALALALGGAPMVVFALKAADVTLRYSVYRLTMELAYLPLSASIRMRAKPIIDGAIVRLVQGCVGGALLFAGGVRPFSGGLLAGVLLALGATWLAAAWTTQGPYLALLRRTIGGAIAGPSHSRDLLDMESAESLLLHLSSEDPLIVVGAMNALTKRNRVRMIPALILLHGDETVLLRALDLFAASDRQDWIARARTLLCDRRERVRMAACRALAPHRELRARDVANDASPRVHAYAALYLALESHRTKSAVEEALFPILTSKDEDGRLGLFSAIADAPLDDRLDGVLRALATRPFASPATTIELARAVRSQRAVVLVPALVSRLWVRQGREAVREALLSFEDVGLDALTAALAESTSRALRMHIPSSIARFGTKRAADILLATIEADKDGLVRYKALRAFGRLVVERGIKVDRLRVERLAEKNLVEYFRLLGLRAGLESTSLPLSMVVASRPPTERLLLGILGDKQRQSLERTFRLLELVHPHDDIERIYDAYRTGDKRARASATELLDAFLGRRDQEHLRRLLRWAFEASSADEVFNEASARIPHPPPATQEEALDRLLSDGDAAVAALAELHVATMRGMDSRVVIGAVELASTSREGEAPSA